MGGWESWLGERLEEDGTERALSPPKKFGDRGKRLVDSTRRTDWEGVIDVDAVDLIRFNPI